MSPLRALALRLGAQPWLPRVAGLIVGVDRLLRRLSGGRITALSLAGLHELLLQVPGRRTGALRTTPLLAVPHREGWLVVGSNWGRTEPPAWVANLRAAQDPIVTVGRRTVAVDAREPSGAERDELWAVALRGWPNFARYAERAGRELPLFWLTPR